MTHYVIHRKWSHEHGAPNYEVYEAHGTVIAYTGTWPCEGCGYTLAIRKCSITCTAKTTENDMHGSDGTRKTEKAVEQKGYGKRSNRKPLRKKIVRKKIRKVEFR